MMKIAVDRFDIEKIAHFYEQQDYQKCNELTKLACEKMGRSTPWLSWMRGVCEDMLGNPFDGLLHFKDALEGDPCNYSYQSALSTNLSIFRNGLLSALEREGSLPYVRNVHKFLVDMGEFTSTHQYLVAKNYVKYGQFKEAQEVLQSFLMNNPNDQEALALEKVLDEASTTAMAS